MNVPILNNFITIAEQVGVVFVIVLLGFAGGRTGLFGDEASDGMANIAVNYVTPALVIMAFQREFEMALVNGFLLTMAGDLLALIAAVAVAIYTLIGRIVRNQVSTSVYTYVVYVSCDVVLLLTCLIKSYALFDYGMSAVIVGLLLALFSTILGHSIFSWCLKYFSPAFVSASKLCEPVVAAMMAGFLFGEMPVLLQILGGMMIIGGVLYYSRIEKEE